MQQKRVRDSARSSPVQNKHYMPRSARSCKFSAVSPKTETSTPSIALLCMRWRELHVWRPFTAMVFYSTKHHLKVLLQLCLPDGREMMLGTLIATISVIWECQTATVLLCVCALDLRTGWPCWGQALECHMNVTCRTEVRASCSAHTTAFTGKLSTGIT